MSGEVTRIIPELIFPLGHKDLLNQFYYNNLKGEGSTDRHSHNRHQEDRQDRIMSTNSRCCWCLSQQND